MRTRSPVRGVLDRVGGAPARSVGVLPHQAKRSQSGQAQALPSHGQVLRRGGLLDVNQVERCGGLTGGSERDRPVAALDVARARGVLEAPDTSSPTLLSGHTSPFR